MGVSFACLQGMGVNFGFCKVFESVLFRASGDQLEPQSLYTYHFPTPLVSDAIVVTNIAVAS